MTTTINAAASTGIAISGDGSGVMKLQSNGKTTNALAWINFNGSTQTVNASYNISSISRSSAGIYVLNFTTSTSDANYVVVGSAVTTGQYAQIVCSYNDNKTTTQATLAVTGYGGGASWNDASTVNAAIFGN